MGYNVYSLRSGGSYGQKSGVAEFERAAKMAKEGIEMMCEIAEEMADQFGERRGGYGNREGYGNRDGYGMRGDYGNRGGYGRRDDEMMDGYGERRYR